MRRLDLFLLVPLTLVALLVGGVVAVLFLRVPLPVLGATLVSEEIAFCLLMSLKSSLMALFLALTAGVPAAYVMARRQFPGKAVLDTILDIPLVMPPLIAGLGLLLLLSRSMLGGPLARWGIEVLFSPVGVVVAQTFVALPVIVRSARAAFASVDPGFALAAATLGATPFSTWVIIELPLAARGIAAGAVLAWARALGEFGATLMVAGATRFRTETLPMAVYLNMATGDTDMAIAAALVLLVLAGVLLLLLRLMAGAARGRVE